MILAAALLLGLPAQVVNVPAVVREAAETMRADWAAAPNYAYVQRETSNEKGHAETQTKQIVLIDGSEYRVPLPGDGHNPTAAELAAVQEKVRAEVRSRQNESPSVRKRRVDKFLKDREQEGVILLELPKAFNFTLAGEETINGRTALRLTAEPKPGYVPPNRIARVLTGMRGTLWIDKESKHWARAEAEVIAPVSMFGFLARVLPGTKFLLDMKPESKSVWLMDKFDVTVVLSKVFVRSSQGFDLRYSDYRPNAEALRDFVQ